MDIIFVYGTKVTGSNPVRSTINARSLIISIKHRTIFIMSIVYYAEAQIIGLNLNALLILLYAIIVD